VPISILERTANRNSVPTMYTLQVSKNLKVAYRIPKPAPRTETNSNYVTMVKREDQWK